MKIGIFGGTFDPCTCAHYEIVKKVLADKLVDEVIVLPTIVDYYRKDKPTMFSLGERKTILKKWFDGMNNVILDFIEYELEKKHAIAGDIDEFAATRRYIDMLKCEMSASRYKCENIQWYTIIGEDSYRNFTTWHKWSEILSLSKLIVFGRSDNIIIDGASRDYAEIVPAAYYRYIDTRFNNISATSIRKRLTDECNGMSMGPSVTPFKLYLEEIEDYKNTGKTYEEFQHALEHAECYVNRDKKLWNKAKHFLEGLKQENNEKLLKDTAVNIHRNSEYGPIGHKANNVSVLEYESLRDKALDMARTLKLIENEAHQCAMCDGREDCGYSADEFLKKVCFLLFQSQGYQKEKL